MSLRPGSGCASSAASDRHVRSARGAGVGSERIRAGSSVPQATFDYLAGLEWIPEAENLCLVGPAGTGKSHLLVALGHAAVAAGHKVRYRGVADNSVGRVIDTLLRHDLLVDEIGFAPLDDTGTQLLVPVRRRRVRSAVRKRRWPPRCWRARRCCRRLRRRRPGVSGWTPGSGARDSVNRLAEPGSAVPVAGAASNTVVDL
jgi:IstB-like ATP binding protein